MSTPGSNILNRATRLIARQTVQYFKFTGRSVNAAFQDVSIYQNAIDIRGSFQPVPRDRYLQMGLDLAKSYWNLYAPVELIGVGRDVSGDQIIFEGRKYQCQSTTPWFSVDGWLEVLCIDIGSGT